MKSREYCCCAIPIVYAGIYTALVEQFALGIIAGTLSVATPSIVGASTPSFAKWIFAIICYVGAALQVLAFVAVRKEKPIFFRRYITLHIMITVAAFAVSAAWIILSATRHSQAKTQCLIDFFPNNSTDSTSASEGDTLCNIFPWADVGIMSGLWILLAIVQIYLYTVMSSYGSAQRRDHQKYNSLYDVSQPLNTSNSYPLTERSPWDSRMSTDSLVRHGRQDSDASVYTVMGDKMQQHAEPGGNTASTYPPQPGNAYTQDPGPTPHRYDDYYSAGAGGGLDYPERSQAHPAEGSFRRKTPRLQKPMSEDYDVGSLSRRAY